MQPLINWWVLRVHKDFTVFENKAFWWLLIEDDIKLDFILLALRWHLEHRVRPHFLPGRSEQWIVLHGVAQKVKCVKRNLDVCRPAPRTLLHFFKKSRQCVIALCGLLHRKHEHASEHLVKNYSHRPNVDFMAVAWPAAPVSIKLLRSHHQGWPFESLRPFSRICNQLSCIS